MNTFLSLDFCLHFYQTYLLTLIPLTIINTLAPFGSDANFYNACATVWTVELIIFLRSLAIYLRRVTHRLQVHRKATDSMTFINISRN